MKQGSLFSILANSMKIVMLQDENRADENIASQDVHRLFKDSRISIVMNKVRQ